jgi:hypothetical protein
MCRNSLDYWKGFCVRSFDFSELKVDNIDTSAMSDIERQYIAWPAVLRTSLHLAQTFLKRVCNSTGLEMVNSEDVTGMLKHMQAAEFVVATKMEDMLFERVVQESTAYSQLLNGNYFNHLRGETPRVFSKTNRRAAKIYFAKAS